MDLNEQFNEAKGRVTKLSERPGNDVLLQLYALYKQGSEGDVQGKRPGMLDLKGRAKYDAWTKKKGLSKDDAQNKHHKIGPNTAHEGPDMARI